MNVFLTGASGYIGGAVAQALIRLGHTVRGLTRSATSADQLERAGVHPVAGDLDDIQLLTRESARADVVINAANADHRGAVAALIAGLQGSGKALIHTSGISIIGDDARGNALCDAVFSEATPLQVDPRKQARRDIDLLVLDAARLNVRSVVIVPSLVYGVGAGLHRHSIQIPFLAQNAQRAGAVQIVGRGVNVWSNVYIDDLVDLYCLACQKAPAGALYFAENGEASFADVAQALSTRLRIASIQPLDAQVAVERWGMARALFTYGSNCRVRAVRARSELAWSPRGPALKDWILSATELY